MANPTWWGWLGGRDVESACGLLGVWQDLPDKEYGLLWRLSMYICLVKLTFKEICGME